jgi:hypothetical protein
MIRPFINSSNRPTSRKGLAVTLLFWLNLALLPCAMAMEVPADGHDCCPSSIELEPTECCDIDDVSVDRKDDRDLDVFSAGPVSYRTELPAPRRAEFRRSAPPDPVDFSPPIHVLNCVYLK